MSAGEGRPFLVAAVSGRLLAASAARGGVGTVVLDAFADLDTRSAARRWRRVAGRGGACLDAGSLLAAAAELAPPAASAGLVYGSGFEGRSGLLRRLAAGRRLYGNPPETIAAVRDPLRVWPLLDRLGIPHPEVRLDAPADPRGWLVKAAGGAGGAGVRRAADAAGARRGRRAGRASGRGAFFQRFEPGRVLSALFLADGRRALLLGVNEVWSAPARRGLPFLYGGAVGGVALPPVVEAEVRAGIGALAAAAGLVGLNGVDFVLRGRWWRVLEVNPRPTATVELYDPDYPRGLFRSHLRACGGELPASPAPARAVRAHLVAYAAAPGRAPDPARLPPGCRDVPAPAVRLFPGEPVCTLHAAAPDAAGALRLLRRRLSRLSAVVPVVASPAVSRGPAQSERASS